jgi:hypothetical protein
MAATGVPAMIASRWLWLDGDSTGPYTDPVIQRMVIRGEVNGQTLFFHDASDQWRPMTHYLDDLHTQQLTEYRRAGYERVEFVAGRTEEECPACQAMHGRRFCIAEAPPIPLPDCTCDPWSRATYTPVRSGH